MKRVMIPIILFVILSTYVFAAKSMYGQRVLINNEIDDNLMVAGSDISVAQEIKGDLMCAGGQVLVDGVVDDDITCAAGMITLDKEVKGDARIAGGNVDIGGKIEGDLVVAGGTVRIRESAVIGKDLIVRSGNVVYLGTTVGNVDIKSASIVYNGIAGKNVFLEGRNIAIEGGHVSGDLTTGSYGDVDASKVEVKGKVYKKVFPAQVVTYRSSIPGRIISFIALFVIGAVLMLISRKYTKVVARKVSSFWKSIGFGFLLLVLVPFAIILMLITIIGIPLALILLVSYLILIYTAKLAVAYWMTERLGASGKVLSIATLALCLLVLFALISIPYAGWIINAILVLTGMGAMTLAGFTMVTGKKNN